MIGQPAHNSGTYSVDDEVEYLLSLQEAYDREKELHNLEYVTFADFVLTHVQTHLYDIQGLKFESEFINSDEYLHYTWKHPDVFYFIGPMCCATVMPNSTPKQIISRWNEEETFHTVLQNIL